MDIPVPVGLVIVGEAGLRRHYTTVHKNGKFTCPFCAAPYASPTELQMHMADRVKRGGCGIRMIDTRPPVVSRARVYEKLVKSGYIRPELTEDRQKCQGFPPGPYAGRGRGNIAVARPTHNQEEAE